MDLFEKHIESMIFGAKENRDPQELFVFGEQIGDGSEEDHFHLGFTSEKLIKNMVVFNNNGTYHIDCTYKIIKYMYPLIVFGFTDITRKFFPIAFMLTSHETTEDFNHFFENLIDTCKQFNQKLIINYIIIDACPALAKSIKLRLTETKFLMCWFHLKMNVKKHKHLIQEGNYNRTLNQIDVLHKSQCLYSYRVCKNVVLLFWQIKIKCYQLKITF